MRTLDECVAEIRYFIKASDSPTFCGGTIIPKQLASEILVWIEKLVELCSDLSDNLPCCIDCDGKTKLGERTENCLFGIKSLDGKIYCASRGVENMAKLAEQVRFVHHAHWIVKPEDRSHPICSHCVTTAYTKHLYCPHCGAIMDEEVEQ